MIDDHKVLEWWGMTQQWCIISIWYATNILLLFKYQILNISTFLHNYKKCDYYQLTLPVCQVYHHIERIYFHWKVWKVKILDAGKYFNNSYLRLRLETLLARLAKLANEILEALWKDIQNMKIWKKRNFTTAKILLLFQAWQQLD